MNKVSGIFKIVIVTVMPHHQAKKCKAVDVNNYNHYNTYRVKNQFFIAFFFYMLVLQNS